MILHRETIKTTKNGPVVLLHCEYDDGRKTFQVSANGILVMFGNREDLAREYANEVKW